MKLFLKDNIFQNIALLLLLCTLIVSLGIGRADLGSLHPLLGPYATDLAGLKAAFLFCLSLFQAILLVAFFMRINGQAAPVVFLVSSLAILVVFMALVFTNAMAGPPV